MLISIKQLILEEFYIIYRKFALYLVIYFIFLDYKLLYMEHSRHDVCV